jgi:hypothetical protein
MTFTARRLAAATITIATLGFNAVSTLAFASATTPKTELAQTVAKLAPTIRENLDPTRAGAIRELSVNVSRCDRAADAVARIRADEKQRAAQRDWVTGVRLQAAADDQLISAVETGGHGRLNNEGQAGLANLKLSDTYIAYAEQLLADDAGPLPTALR